MKRKIDYTKPHKLSKNLEDRMLEEAKSVCRVDIDENGNEVYVPLYDELKNKY